MTASALRALVAGLAGSSALTLVHEGARRVVPHAPRVDVLGMRAIARGVRAVGGTPPGRDARYFLALAGDLASNGVYYSLAAAGAGQAAGAAWGRGAALGLLAGLGAVLLPEPLGLGRQPGRRSPVTEALTVAWYLIGGLTAAGVWIALDGRRGGAGVGASEGGRVRVARVDGARHLAPTGRAA